MSFTESIVLGGCLIVGLILPFGVNSFLLEDKTKCYGDLGCFSSGSPYRDDARPLSAVPSSPDNIRTLFILHTRDNTKAGQELDARKVKDAKSTWTYFKKRPTKFIVHGFLDDTNLVSWLKDMKTELLIHGDYNAIIVDWHHGNLFPYTQATANTRVVGAQIALLIEQLKTDFEIDPDQVHIIGHSLGAHIAGYAGERVEGLGRITGLDPAGPYFAGTDKVVRLDPTDALLVDTIHSDAEKLIKLGFGMRQAVGHMDFYPNLGHDQPGCEKDPLNLLSVLVKQGIEDTVACNHLRSIKYFTESINTKCPFKAFPCKNEDDFNNKKCHSCDKGSCASMGFNADKNVPTDEKHVKYYTATSDEAPYCQYHIDIKISLASSSKSKSERGTMKVRLRGEKRVSHWLPLYTDPISYQPGNTYEKEVGMPRDIGKLLSVEFQWHHVSSLTDPSSWNPFGFRSPKLYVHDIDIIHEDFGREVIFCADNAAVENNESLMVYKRCS